MQKFNINKKYLQELEKSLEKKSRCCKSDKVYEVDVPYQETLSFYEIDLLLTSQGIQQSIDSQVQRNLELLQRVIEKQISEDFRKGEKQIDDYINRFQSEFEYLIKERVMKEVQADEIIADLETQRIEVNEYLHELTLIRELLDNCKPTIVN